MNIALLNKLKKQDLRAQEIIYKKNAPYLFRLIYRYVGSEEKTGEILNDTFYKAFIKINTYNDDHAKFSYWLKKIAINESLQFLRKQKEVYTIGIDEVQNNEMVSNSDPNIDLEYYYKLILELPERYRIIFNLAAIEGYTHKEISKKLNLEENTSRSLLLRARRLLMNKIKL